ncbi:HET-domain-containing protein, partial [Canariomyces notabilis]
LEECTTEHRACNMAKPPWHPSRLVDLGCSRSSNNDVYPRFSIVKGSKVSPGQKYITLSHRWGLSHTPRITVQNLGAYEQGMPMSALPMSFRDAITVAQRLGIRYIWIDSLCIIQDGDNGQDWRREAPLMEKVYANAFCNLAANWGSDSVGHFFERDTTLFGPNRFPIIHNLTYNLFINGNSWIQEVMDAPLNKRGWVLQERILAPRIIHFCRHEVFWECCENTVSESFPAKLPPIDQSTGDYLLPGLIHSLDSPGNSTLYERTGSKSNEAGRLYDLWHSVVEIYTRCRLTKQSDKLVAIAGLARSLSPFLRDLYVAGVWSRNLVIDLAWYMAEPELVSRDSSLPYRAPSFSWASVNAISAGH